MNKKTNNEQDVPEMAVQALQNAHRQAMQSNRPILFAKDGFLYQKFADGRVVRKSKLPDRVPVTRKIKRSKPAESAE